tara:strand:+ start:20 stop:442 length:423 start_codon:yes stop_codon:yes gene_type:complete
MEAISNLKKLITGDNTSVSNQYKNLTATEKKYINLLQQTMNMKISDEDANTAKSKMNELAISPKRKSELKDLNMENENRKSKNNKGGSILKKNVEKMSYGGMSGGKKHMYSAGGSVKDNAGLSALKKASPEAYANIKRNS